jgi:hypothetical protein
VDDVEVARDTATNLDAAGGGLYIGAGSDLEPGTFWSGLIDDVRIYDRALTPEQITKLAQQTILERNKTLNIVKG